MMQEAFPVSYIEPVFRPPSEAHSLILPVTNGCSWNKCTFCEMYTQPQKKFRARKPEDVLQDIRNAARSLGGVRRVFLADGDALNLSTDLLDDKEFSNIKILDIRQKNQIVIND